MDSQNGFEFGLGRVETRRGSRGHCVVESARAVRVMGAAKAVRVHARVATDWRLELEGTGFYTFCGQSVVMKKHWPRRSRINYFTNTAVLQSLKVGARGAFFFASALWRALRRVANPKR